MCQENGFFKVVKFLAVHASFVNVSHFLVSVKVTLRVVDVFAADKSIHVNDGSYW